MPVSVSAPCAPEAVPAARLALTAAGATAHAVAAAEPDQQVRTCQAVQPVRRRAAGEHVIPGGGRPGDDALGELERPDVGVGAGRARAGDETLIKPAGHHRLAARKRRVAVGIPERHGRRRPTIEREAAAAGVRVERGEEAGDGHVLPVARDLAGDRAAEEVVAVAGRDVAAHVVAHPLRNGTREVAGDDRVADRQRTRRQHAAADGYPGAEVRVIRIVARHRHVRQREVARGVNPTAAAVDRAGGVARDRAVDQADGTVADPEAAAQEPARVGGDGRAGDGRDAGRNGDAATCTVIAARGRVECAVLTDEGLVDREVGAREEDAAAVIGSVPADDAALDRDLALPAAANNAPPLPAP